MKKLLLIFTCALLSFGLKAQESTICRNDVSFFVDTVSFELINQLPDGFYKVYFDSLKTIIDCSGEINDNKRIGDWTWYHYNGGKKRQVTYKDGKIHGQDKYYYPNGQQSLSIPFTEGVQNGFTSGWYLNGTKMFEGTYLNGNPSETWKCYNEDGTLFKEEKHTDISK